MLTGVVAYISAHALASTGGGFLGGSVISYWWQSSKLDSERQRNQQTEGALREQNRHLEEHTADLQEQVIDLEHELSQAKEEICNYKLLLRSLLRVREMSREIRLGSEDILNVTREAIIENLRVLVDNEHRNLEGIFTDPITADFLDDPRVLPCGRSVNASTVEALYQRPSPVCPFTRELLPMNPHTLPKNHALIELHDFLKSIDLYEWVVTLTTDKDVLAQRLGVIGVVEEVRNDQRSSSVSEPASAAQAEPAVQDIQISSPMMR